MKCNVRELAHLSDQPCVIEGRLNYRKISNGGYRNQSVFKERWFRLIKNYLFYFKISDMGKFDTKNPAGVFVLENSSIQMEHGKSIPFSFSVSFIDEAEKRHIFSARTEDNVVQWVMKLRECSYEYLRSRLHTLQSKIYSMTGKDPLLLVPRNEGACLWAPSIPFSTTPACTVNTSSFSCHLHTNGAFTLERSKSDIQAHFHAHCKETSNSKQTKFYTNDVKLNSEKPVDSSSHTFILERSKTSNVFDDGIFDNRPAYSRAAPSPPVRTKLSPSLRRVEVSEEVKSIAEMGRYLATTSIMNEAPVPPKRKISPKPVETENVNSSNSKSNDDQKGTQDKDGDDLIRF